MATLQILGGRKEKIRPGDVLGALTGEAGFTSAQVGKITVTDPPPMSRSSVASRTRRSAGWRKAR
jgi:hypothetical protein